MKTNVYSVFDEKAKVFSNPFYQHNDALAERSFISVTIDPATQIFRTPEDYRLYRLAVFDDETGRFETLEIPELVVSGVEAQMKGMKHDAQKGSEVVSGS